MIPLSEKVTKIRRYTKCDHCFNCLYHTERRHFFDGFLCPQCGYWETMVLGVLEAGFDPEVQKHYQEIAVEPKRPQLA